MSENAIIKKAFNTGYLLEKYIPKLSKLIQDSLKDNPTLFMQGFRAGSQQFIQEQTPTKSRLLERLKEDAKAKLPPKEKGKDEKQFDKEI
jgi:hypothetical protein